MAWVFLPLSPFLLFTFVATAAYVLGGVKGSCKTLRRKWRATMEDFDPDKLLKTAAERFKRKGCDGETVQYVEVRAEDDEDYEELLQSKICQLRMLLRSVDPTCCGAARFSAVDAASPSASAAR